MTGIILFLTVQKQNLKNEKGCTCYRGVKRDWPCDSPGIAGNGYDLAVNGVRAENQLGEVLESLKKQDARVVYCQGDIGNSAERQNVYDTAIAAFGEN
jgi:hypothetical protein